MNKIIFSLIMSLCVSCNYYENTINDTLDNVEETLKSNFDIITYEDENNEQSNIENAIMSNIY